MDALGDVGNAISGIAKSVKTAKNLGSANGALSRIITDTKRQAEAVEKISMPGEVQLVHLKDQIRTVQDCAVGMEVFCTTFNKEGDVFENSVKKIINKGTLSNEDVGQCAKEVGKMHEMSVTFKDEFAIFYQALQTAQETASKFYSYLENQGKQTREEAKSTRNWGVAKSVGLGALSGAAVAALFFFAAPVAVIGLGALAVGAAVGSAYCGYNAYLDFKQLTGIADKFDSQANEMKTFAEELRVISQRAWTQTTMNAEMVNSLRLALNFCQRDLEQQRQIAEKNTTIKDQEEEIRRLREQLATMQTGSN